MYGLLSPSVSRAKPATIKCVASNNKFSGSSSLVFPPLLVWAVGLSFINISLYVLFLIVFFCQGGVVDVFICCGVFVMPRSKHLSIFCPVSCDLPEYSSVVQLAYQEEQLATLHVFVL